MSSKDNNIALSEHKHQKQVIYIIRVDKQKYEIKKENITGAEILILAQKNPPERYQLNQKLKGGTVKAVSLTDEIDLTDPGIEKFMTIPLDQRGG